MTISIEVTEKALGPTVYEVYDDELASERYLEFEEKFDDLVREYARTDYSNRDDLDYDAIDLSDAIEDYMSILDNGEEGEEVDLTMLRKFEELFYKLSKIHYTEYEGETDYDPYSYNGVSRKDFY